MTKKTIIILISMILLISSLASATINDAKVYYSLDDDDNTGNNPNDISGNGNDGTNTGATIGATGHIGEAFTFGANDKLDSDYNVGTSAFTVMGWFKLSSVNHAMSALFTNLNYDSADSDGWYFYFRPDDKYTSWSIYESNVQTNLHNGVLSSLTVDTNYHLYTITYDGVDSWELFQDMNSLKNATKTLTQTPDENIIFCVNTGGTDTVWWYGNVDETAIFNRVLSNAEIEAYYTMTENPYVVTSTYFDITATDLYDDSSLTNFTATLNGTTYTTTNGTINTGMNANAGLFNIVLTSNDTGGYYSTTYNNYNISSNLEANFTRNYVTITSATDLHGNTVLGTVTLTNGDYETTGTLPLIIGGTKGTNNIVLNLSGWHNTTYTTTLSAVTNTSEGLTGLHNSKIIIGSHELVGGSSINTFDINSTDETLSLTTHYSTTTGNITFPAMNNTNYTITIDATGYAITTDETVTILTNEMTENHNFSLYETNTLNITFIDEDTGNTITGTNISLELISPLFANNYTTSNGLMYITLLTPEDYTMRYSASDYPERFYYLTVSNRSYQKLSLYMINESLASNITINVIDKLTFNVENAKVKALKYDITTNTYLLQEVGITNYAGETILSLTMSDEYYKFIVEYNDQTMLTTTPAYILSDSLTIQINLGTEVGEDFDNYMSLDYDLTFNDLTNNFRLNYNDVNGIIEQVCVNIESVKMSGVTPYNSSCLSSASGTILVGVHAINGTLYRAKAYYYESGERKLLDIKEHFYPSSDVWGTYGLFLQIIITLCFVMLGLWTPALSCILVPVSLLLGRAINLTTFDYVYLIPLVVIGVICAWLVNKR